MKRNLILPVFLLVILATLLSGCTGSIAATSWPGLSVKDNIVYAAYGPRVYAINADNGSMVWQYPEKADRRVFFAEPVRNDGLVIAGDFSSNLVAIDANNGTERWRFTGANGGRFIGGPVVVGNTILAPSSDRYLYAVDFNGQLLWKFKAKEAMWSRPVSDGTTVYQASMDHNLYAIDLQSGQQKWVIDMGGAIVYSPLLSEDGRVLYIANLANDIVALDTSNGSTLWKTPIGQTLWSKPTFLDGRLYFGDLAGNAYALDAANGSQVWTMKLGEGVAITGAPTIFQDSVVFATEANGLIAISLDGSKRLWTKEVNGKLYNGPVVAGEKLVVGITSGQNLLVAVNPAGGDLWSFAPAK